MKAIFATTQNFLLGLNGTMPWCLSDAYKELGRMDMQFFKEITKESKVVMGMNTWKSLGEKPLKGRKDHFVITTAKNLTHEDSRVRFMDLHTFVKKYANDDEIVCIGGGQIYKQLLPHFKEIFWNELKLDDSFIGSIRQNSKGVVYLNKNIIHLLTNPSQVGFEELTTAMNFDSEGRSITYKRFLKRKCTIPDK